MLVQRILNRRRRPTELVESESAGSAASTKKEEFVDEVAPAVSPTSREGKMVMKKLVEAMPPVGSIYDVYFMHLVKEHDLDAGQDLAGKVDFVSPDPSHILRRARVAHSLEYVEIGMQNMKEMAKSLRNMM